MTKAAVSSRIAAVRDIPVTVLVSPHQVTKRFELDGDGQLLKSAAVPVGKARVEQWSVGSARGLAQAITEVMTPNEVIMLGHFADGVDYIVPRGVSLSAGHAHRTKDCTSWSNGPQWMVLDVDKSHCVKPMTTPEEVHAALVEVAPCLDDVEMLVVSSGSSGIFTTEGRELSGYGGWHVWVRLARGTDWPDFVEWLVQRCWMNGQFRHVVSASGSLLERGLIDQSVSSPERVQYSGPSTLGAGLVQHRRWGVFGEEGRELSNWKRLNADEKKSVAQRKELSRHAMSGHADEVREQWLEKRRDRLMARGMDKVGAVSKSLAALEGHLDDEWELILESGKAITVGELLADRATYDGVRCLDPLEPEYADHSPVGRIFWRENGKKPILHSFAHGGANYTLGGKVDTLSALVKDLVYITEERVFVSLSNPSVCYNRESLNFVYGHELDNAYKQMLGHMDKQVAAKRVWWPGKDLMFDFKGTKCLNDCPDLTIPAPGAVGDDTVQPWLDHMAYIYGDTMGWVMDHMAYMVQHPGDKQHAHPIIGGAHGIGKDLSVYPLRAWFQGHGCLGEVGALPSILDYDDQLVHAKLVVVSECSINDLDVKSRDRLSTKLKAMTVSNGPDEVISLNVKCRGRAEHANLSSWWMFTNHASPLELERGDRRFMFHWCREAPKDPAYYDALVDWLQLNWEAVIRWLAARDWKGHGYNPKAPAPMTKEKEGLIEQRDWDDDSIIPDILTAFEDVPAVSLHAMMTVAVRHLGLEFKSEAGGLKALGAKLRRMGLKTGIMSESLRGQPEGKGTPTIQRKAAILDVDKWSALGTQNDKLRYLLKQEKDVLAAKY